MLFKKQAYKNNKMKLQLLNQNIELRHQPIFAPFFAPYLWRQKLSVKIWVNILFISLIINNIHTALEYYFYSIQGIDWIKKKHFFEWVQWHYFLSLLLAFAFPSFYFLKLRGYYNCASFCSSSPSFYFFPYGILA